MYINIRWPSVCPSVIRHIIIFVQRASAINRPKRSPISMSHDVWVVIGIKLPHNIVPCVTWTMAIKRDQFAINHSNINWYPFEMYYSINPNLITAIHRSASADCSATAPTWPAFHCTRAGTICRIPVAPFSTAASSTWNGRDP